MQFQGGNAQQLFKEMHDTLNSPDISGGNTKFTYKQYAAHFSLDDFQAADKNQDL